MNENEIYLHFHMSLYGIVLYIDGFHKVAAYHMCLHREECLLYTSVVMLYSMKTKKYKTI